MNQYRYMTKSYCGWLFHGKNTHQTLDWHSQHTINCTQCCLQDEVLCCTRHDYILYDFSQWYWSLSCCSLPLWLHSIWFQSVVLIAKLLFVVFCMTLIYGMTTKLLSLHDHVLCDFSLWYWSPSCHSLPSWLYSVWFHPVALITVPPFVALMIVFCMICLLYTSDAADER